jgi:hypothetical protein
MSCHLRSEKDKNFFSLVTRTEMIEINYSGKCDNCGRTNPSLTVPIVKDRSDDVHSTELWCIDCLRSELHKDG